MLYIANMVFSLGHLVFFSKKPNNWEIPESYWENPENFGKVGFK